MTAGKRLGLGVVVAAVALLGARAAGAANVTQFKSSGSTAVANTFDAVPLDLAVDVNGNGSNATTNLFFNKETCDDNGCSGIFGFGTIPNGDFSGGTGSSKLNTNLATNSSYSVFSFTIDFNTGNSTQTQITGGIIHIDWKAIPRNSTHQSGESTVTSGAFSVHRSGSSDFVQATATGTFFGVPIGPGQNSIGTSKSMSVTITRD